MRRVVQENSECEVCVFRVDGCAMTHRQHALNTHRCLQWIFSFIFIKRTIYGALHAMLTLRGAGHQHPYEFSRIVMAKMVIVIYVEFRITFPAVDTRTIRKNADTLDGNSFCADQIVLYRLRHFFSELGPVREKAKETIKIISKKMRHPKDVPNRRRVIDRKTETTCLN